ncbi:MAG: DNA-binding protein [Bacteroidales bacterium]|nr:DNA-binding protein [Bacteroidales bacterium]
MKLRNIFTILAAALTFAFVGCQEEERFLSEVKVSSSYVALPAEGGSQTIDVTAVGAWEFTGIPEWLTVSPASGSGDATVTFTAGKAESTNEAALELVCEGAVQTINVLQMTEKLEVPISTCAEVNNGQDGVVYRVKGTVTSIANTTYGNWYLQDETGSVYIYGTLYDGAEKQFTKHGIEVGDIVTVEGPRKDYNGTIELVNVTVIEIEKSLIKVDEVSPEDATLPIEGGEFTVTLTAKGEGVTVVVPEAAQSWLSVTGVSASASTTVVTFTAAANAGGDRETELTFKTTSNGVEYTAVTALKQTGSIVECSVADFLAQPVGTALFKLTGRVAKLQTGDYGNFDLVDGTGSVYVYGLTATKVEKNDKSFPSLGIKEGDVVTLIGTRAEYNGTAQVGGPAYYVSHIGHKTATVAEFLAAAEDDTRYMLTGIVSNIAMDKNDPTKQSAYGNFDLTDETGTVYVYGLTAGPVAKNDKTFPNLGIKEGDKVTLIGTRTSYNGTAQVGGPAYYISHETPAEGGDDTGNEGGNEEGGDDEGDNTTGETGPFTSNITWTLGAGSYDGSSDTAQTGTINGEEVNNILKLGTSKAGGSATLTIPAGTVKVGFWGVAWKNKKGTLTVKAGDTTLFEKDLASNDGASSNPPYTITAADSDYYEITLDAALAADTEVTVSTTDSAPRVLLWGLNSYSK